VATGGANDVLQASAGVETLNAVASSGSDAFFGGSGSDCIIGGSGANVFTAGPGNMTLIGGGARDLYVFLDGATSTTVIADFNPTHDYIRLSGFPSGAAQTALQGATASGGNTTMTLGDGTKVTFDGLAPGALERFHPDWNRRHAKIAVPKRPPSTIRQSPVSAYRRDRCFGGVANPIRRIFANVSSPRLTMANGSAGSRSRCVSACPMSQRSCRGADRQDRRRRCRNDATSHPS
jgi:hypothetical protein